MIAPAMIGDFIRSHRRAKGWTQAELASRLHIKRETLSWWERSLTKTPPPQEMASRMAGLFGVEVDEVLRAWGYPLDEMSRPEVDRLNTEEQEAIELLRALPPSQRELQLSALRALRETLLRQEQRRSGEDLPPWEEPA